MNRTIKLVRAWHFWSDVWLHFSLTILLVFAVAALFCLRFAMEPGTNDWLEANGLWIVLVIQAVGFSALAWQWYCGHRMSLAKYAVDCESELVARELDA